MQAQGVYNYFSGHCYSVEAIIDGLPSEPTMQKTESDKGNYFKAVAASPKQVRGPHPDVLQIDEACETKDQLILDALPMVNTSSHAVVIMTSTFHKIFGLFQETWDRAEELGYCRISWDILDVTRSFDPAIWEDDTLLAEIPDLTIEQAGEKSLEHRVGGRVGDPDGWVDFGNVVQAWREKDSIDWFDVEYMGLRPSAAGMVNDPEDVDACVIADLSGDHKYVPGSDTAAGLDWGFQGMTAWDVEMLHKDRVKVQLESRTWTQVRSEKIIDQIVKDVIKYRISAIRADSSHPFENADLKARLSQELRDGDFRCSVVEVKFLTDKEKMLGNYRAHFQQRLNRIPAAFKEAIWQHKRYRYQKNSDKPVKEDDHCPDAKMLALEKWPINKRESKISKSNTEKEAQQGKGRENRNVTGGLLDERF